MADPQEVQPGDEAAAATSPDLADAYLELGKSLSANPVGAETLKQIGVGFRKAAGLNHIGPVLSAQLEEQIEKTRGLVPPWGGADVELALPEPDTRPSEIVSATQRTAELIGQQNAAIAQLVELTINSLALSQTQQEQSRKSDRFSRRMTWTSVILTGATVAVSLAALIVAVTTGS